MTLTPESNISIILPQNATLPEQTAARELDNYLTRISGGDFIIVNEPSQISTNAIYVGATQYAKNAGIDESTLPSEEWHIKTHNDNLILIGGGTRGTLYATYHFLEDIAGVRWWTPWEEDVPAQKVLLLSNLDKHGKPAFSYRDVYMTYGSDKGRFAIRNRLDRNGDSSIGAEYGGSHNYGPPYHVHTFFKILSPEKYFSAHPDWFLGSGKTMPTANTGQLNMSNPEMRKEFLKLLREIIRKSYRDAKSKGLPAPEVFSVSQEDNHVSFIGSSADEALVKANGGAESSILLSFVNYLADGIKDEFPDVYIDTLAYFSGVKAPTSIRPRDNVIIRLCSTGIMLLPITDPHNRAFHDNVIAWSKISRNLRVWRYGISFRVPSAPLPVIANYGPDLRFLLQNHVNGIFTELQHPLTADMRDMKLWILCKLLEDPTRDTKALINEFTDGYYGAAAPKVREYLTMLNDTVQMTIQQTGLPEITMGFTGLNKFTYLTREFFVKADAIYDEAAAKVANDPVLSRRVRRARYSVDDAQLMRFPNLVNEWVQAGNTPETFTFDRAKIAARGLQTQREQIDLQLPAQQRTKAHETASLHFAKLTAGPIYIPTPAKFQNVPLRDLLIYGANDTRNYKNKAVVVSDKQAESGTATRYEIPDSEQKTPMIWGIYETRNRTNLLIDHIKPETIPGAGYHWYRMGDVTFNNNRSYVFFTWSWFIQVDLNSVFDANNPEQQYEVWANLKFEGPAFPHGSVNDKNAIYVERLALVKK